MKRRCRQYDELLKIDLEAENHPVPGYWCDQCGHGWCLKCGDYLHGAPTATTFTATVPVRTMKAWTASLIAPSNALRRSTGARMLTIPRPLGAFRALAGFVSACCPYP